MGEGTGCWLSQPGWPKQVWQGDIEGNGIDVNEDRGGAEEADHLGCGDEGKRRGEDRIARADAVSHERHEEGVGARSAADGVLYTHV